MASPADIPASRVRVLLLVTVVVTALATHWVDRETAVYLPRLSAPEITAATVWLDQLYASAEGLQRPGGLCASGQLDSAAISQWLFEGYLVNRSRQSPDEARATIRSAIEASDEWKTKHK
jgi:hypothetical protein